MPKILLDTSILPRQGKLQNVVMSAVLRVANADFRSGKSTPYWPGWPGSLRTGDGRRRYRGRNTGHARPHKVCRGSPFNRSSPGRRPSTDAPLAGAPGLVDVRASLAGSAGSFVAAYRR